jgi:hypothetical protein
MQNAKDTFFQMLQARIAALNPARTVEVRGLTRPGVLVPENELPSAAVSTDVFRLDWTGVSVDGAKGTPLVTMQCTIRYATDGTMGAGGMDRGRALAAMDVELLDALRSEPRNTPKLSYSTGVTGTTAKTLGTRVFWGDPVFGPCEIVGERLTRTAIVQVLSYQEAGEL